MTTDDTGTDAGTTDGRIENPSVDDLAAVGARLGDDGAAWTAALRAYGSYGINSGRDPSDTAVQEIVAGQVYAELPKPDPAATDTVQTFVERFARVYDLDDAEAIGTLLGREQTEQQAYEGRLAFQGDA
jgi:hypothetical protein